MDDADALGKGSVKIGKSFTTPWWRTYAHLKWRRGWQMEKWALWARTLTQQRKRTRTKFLHDSSSFGHIHQPCRCVRLKLQHMKRPGCVEGDMEKSNFFQRWKEGIFQGLVKLKRDGVKFREIKNYNERKITKAFAMTALASLFQTHSLGKINASVHKKTVPDERRTDEL
jgi:hypothetical protein